MRRLLLIRYPLVGPNRRLTAVRSSSGSSTTGSVLIAGTRYRRIRLSFAPDVTSTVSSGHTTTLNVVPTVLLLGRGERNLRRQPIARDERAQVVVVLCRRWRRWPRLHYAGIKLLLEWKHVKLRVVGRNGRTLR